jgi:hypothetical protein
MLRRFGIPTLALTAALAVAAPTVTLARDRDDHRGGNTNSHESFHGRDNRSFDRDDRRVDRDDHSRFNFGAGFYRGPVPAQAASGFYDQYGVWHPYGFYDQFGVWHPYAY